MVHVSLKPCFAFVFSKKKKNIKIILNLQFENADKSICHLGTYTKFVTNKLKFSLHVCLKLIAEEQFLSKKENCCQMNEFSLKKNNEMEP